MIGLLRALRPCWIATALVITAGCGSGSNAHTADPNQAGQTLRTVLDAWKAGEKQEDLEKRTPPIHVKDTDWDGGFTLVGYQAGETGKVAGYDVDCRVTLELKSPQGKAVKKNAIYTITTRPELLVSRQEG
jgi:hypothetical protein